MAVDFMEGNVFLVMCIYLNFSYNVVSFFHSYVEQIGSHGPIAVCMERDIGINIKYSTWKMCQRRTIVPITLCNSITIMFKQMGLGIFEIIGPKLVKLMDER